MKKKVLFIEDDQIFANIYRNKLVLDGFQVEIANNGESGLAMLRSFHPDIVLLDLMLPTISGIDVIKKIRIEPDFQKLPLVVFTNTYLTTMLQDAWKAGATKCLTKANCTPHEVIGTLTTILKNGSATPAQKAELEKAAASPTVPTKAPPTVESQFEADLRKTFIESLPGTLVGVRSLLQNLFKADNDGTRLDLIKELYARIHTLTGGSSIVGLTQITQLADALEALLKELNEKPKNINASTLRTVASAIDYLGILLDQGATVAKDAAPSKVLVVDDEEISRRAIINALDKAKLKSVNMDDPLKALDRLSQDRFDLIFLDIDMPGMNGFELCSRLRMLPTYKKTPVVFVTNLTDFESRANSTMSGGNDFIGKPFLFMELAVKALVYIWRSRLPAKK